MYTFRLGQPSKGAGHFTGDLNLATLTQFATALNGTMAQLGRITETHFYFRRNNGLTVIVGTLDEILGEIKRLPVDWTAITKPRSAEDIAAERQAVIDGLDDLLKDLDF